MQIYDPRRGEDFVLENINGSGRKFSSLNHQLFIIDSQRELVEEQLLLLKNCIPVTSTIGFFTLAPWVPGAKQLRKRIHGECISLSEHEGTVNGSFDVNSLDTIDRLIKIRSESGGERTGEWGFGGLTVPLSEPKRTSLTRGELWDFFHILAQAEKIGSFFYLGDNITTFMTRLFDRFDLLLNNIIRNR